MAFQKGQKKTGGKKKGSENKLTKTAREIFVATLENQVEHIDDAFEQVREKDPAKYLELYAKYAQYFIPKKVDVTTNDKPLEAPIVNVLPPKDE